MTREDTIKLLLDKYLEGETTVKEEQQLTDYFNHEDVKPEWQAYNSMFSFFQVTKEEQPTKPFTTNKTVPLWRSWQNIAAVLLLAVVASFFFRSQQTVNQDLGTFEDPELALAETIKVFDMIGDKLNTGQKEMKHLTTLETTKTKYINLITP